ncbi:MAG: molybdopterin-containing oxidoreductase family protein [Gammaproteobacteria bacterium]
MATSSAKTFLGACPHDCPDTCAMVYEVEDGKLTGVRGNADNPMTRGGLCSKVNDYEKRHYHPDRIQYPLRRTGPKGTKQFERITWDDALDEISTRWKAIIAEYGSQAIMPYSYAGHQGLINGLNGGDAFFNRLGATVCEKTWCGAGASTAWLLIHGPSAGMDPESFAHSKYIVIWACNSVSSNLHHWHFVKEAQKNGAKVVVIDSYRSLTAKQADWHIAPKPGTDGAFAMAVINTLFAEDLLDHDYVEQYTLGHEALAERAKERTAEWAADVTGIPAAEIRQFAREFSSAKPAAIRIGVALEKHYGGGQTVRAVCAIPALTGAWREVGGGIMQMPFWNHPYKSNVISQPEFIPEGTRVVNNLQFGRALLGELDLDPPIKSVMCWNTNPVTQAPEADKIVKGLLREDLFLVSAEHFISDTAAFADIILPAAMGAEIEDIMFTWGHNYLIHNTKCIEPPGEAVSNREIFRQLSSKMGFQDECLHWSDEQCLENFVDWDADVCAGISLETLKKTGYARLSIAAPDEHAPHREGNFPTPSGKCEFYSEAADNGDFVVGAFRQMYEAFQPGTPLDRLPDYVAPLESPASNPARAATYPLNIISPKSHGFLNSCYANMESKIKNQGEQFTLISAADAAQRGIADQAKVKVFNDRGAFESVARITDDVQPGLLVATVGYWRQLNKGTVNAVSSAELVNMGHAATFSDNLVQIEPIK